MEAQTQWTSSPRPLSRLDRDMQAGVVSTANSELRKKIIPFPGHSKSAGERSGFKVNTAVTHPQFGLGKVIGVDGDGGIVSVLFDEHGLKKILADAEGFRALDE